MTTYSDYLIEIGFHCLELRIADDIDMDDRFEALCLDTGETLMINGWMIDSEELLQGSGNQYLPLPGSWCGSSEQMAEASAMGLTALD